MEGKIYKVSIHLPTEVGSFLETIFCKFLDGLNKIMQRKLKEAGEDIGKMVENVKKEAEENKEKK